MSKILDRSYSTQVLSKTSMWEHVFKDWTMLSEFLNGPTIQILDIKHLKSQSSSI